MKICSTSLVIQFSAVQLLSRVQLFATPWITARQASLSITNSRSSLKLTSIESVMPSSHLILCRPFSSCPQSLPASESFPISQLLCYWLYSLLLPTGSSIEAGKATGDPDFLSPKSRERYLFYFCTCNSVPKRPCSWLCWSHMPTLDPASVGRRMGSLIGSSLGRMLIPVLRWDTAL